jgi:flagellar basal-body rod protein FlgC
MSSLLSAINASASALDAQRARMEIAVSNLANAESGRSERGEPYRRRDVVLEAVPFESRLDAYGTTATGVRVAAIVEDQSDFRRRFDPSNDDADADGFVAMPNVEVADEMVDLLGAARAYQANLVAIGLIRDTVQKALELAQ